MLQAPGNDDDDGNDYDDDEDGEHAGSLQKGGVLQTSELTKETADAQIAQIAQFAQLAHSQETETFAISKKNVSVGILSFPWKR